MAQEPAQELVLVLGPRGGCSWRSPGPLARPPMVNQRETQLEAPATLHREMDGGARDKLQRSGGQRVGIHTGLSANAWNLRIHYLSFVGFQRESGLPLDMTLLPRLEGGSLPHPMIDPAATQRKAVLVTPS